MLARRLGSVAVVSTMDGSWGRYWAFLIWQLLFLGYTVVVRPIEFFRSTKEFKSKYYFIYFREFSSEMK
jgi:hypothetical protein